MLSLNISCRLSLQYHPDKNKSNGAQEKFAEINNGITNFFFYFAFNRRSLSIQIHEVKLTNFHPYNQPSDEEKLRSFCNFYFIPFSNCLLKKNVDLFFLSSSAYDILSDEEKKKNYDLYGDDKGNPGFDAGYPGDNGGYTYFTSSGPGQSRFTSRPGEWQNMGGQGSSRSFSFSFGTPGGSSSFGFGLDDIFSDFFGGNFKGRQQFSGFSSFSRSTGSHSGSKSSSGNLRAINSQVFKKEIAGRGMTWLLLLYSSSVKRDQFYESIIQEVANSLEGALKVHGYWYIFVWAFI